MPSVNKGDKVIPVNSTWQCAKTRQTLREPLQVRSQELGNRISKTLSKFNHNLEKLNIHYARKPNTSGNGSVI